MSDINSKKQPIIECDNLIKIYKTSEVEVVALQGLDLKVHEGEFMAIIGNSGSGKSTLLNMIGGLDRASAGKLIVDEKDLFKLNEKELIEYKRDSVGFVWQNNARNLLPYLTALENIELVMGLKKGKEKREKALELLEMVGLSHRKNNKLSQLSGGEQQRVAIAIALSNDPKIILADEPTGSVDTRTSDRIFKIFRKLNEELNKTIVIVTHDRSLSSKVDRVISISDGRTSSEMIRKRSYAEEINNIQNAFGEEVTHEEFAVIDKIGRIHLPKEYVKALNLNDNKLRLDKEEDKIILYK